MDRDDVDVILLLVVSQRHIERPARLDFGHQEEFRKRLGVQVFLDYAAVTDHILSLLPGDAPLSKPHAVSPPALLPRRQPHPKTRPLPRLRLRPHLAAMVQHRLPR